MSQQVVLTTILSLFIQYRHFSQMRLKRFDGKKSRDCVIKFKSESFMRTIYTQINNEDNPVAIVIY